MRPGSPVQLICLSLLIPSLLEGCTHAYVKPERSPVAAAPSNTVPAGSLVGIELQQPLSTATNHPGDRFTGELLDPITDNAGQTVVPKGAKVDGEVTSTKHADIGGQSVGFGLKIDSVQKPGEGVLQMPLEVAQAPMDTTPLVGRILLGGLGGAAVGAGVGVGINYKSAGVITGSTFIGLGLGALAGWLFGRRDATIPAGSVVTLRVTRDIPTEQPADATPPAPPVVPRPAEAAVP